MAATLLLSLSNEKKESNLKIQKKNPFKTEHPTTTAHDDVKVYFSKPGL